MYRWGGGGGGVPSGKPGVGGGGGDDASGGCVERVEVGRRGTQGRRLLGGVCASMVVVRICGETGQRGAAETDGGRRAENLQRPPTAVAVEATSLSTPGCLWK